LSEEDDDLIARCLKKDAAAEYQLYQRYARRMFGFCLRYAVNESEAEEILQLGFIRVFTRLDQFQPEKSLDAWVNRIFITTTINYHVKNLKFAREVELSEAEEYSLVEENVISGISAREMLSAIQSLPVSYRTIFNMYVIENYDHNEISRMLGITVGTSKSQLKRAKAAVRRRLREHEQRYYTGE
jgi:RNA polymerase sigma-70 factor (ECF subfamily)